MRRVGQVIVVQVSGSRKVRTILAQAAPAVLRAGRPPAAQIVSPAQDCVSLSRHIRQVLRVVQQVQH